MPVIYLLASLICGAAAVTSTSPAAGFVLTVYFVGFALAAIPSALRWNARRILRKHGPGYRYSEAALLVLMVTR